MRGRRSSWNCSARCEGSWGWREVRGEKSGCDWICVGSREKEEDQELVNCLFFLQSILGCVYIFPSKWNSSITEFGARGSANSFPEHSRVEQGT